MLDGVEAELISTHPQIVNDSVALQSDCGNTYMDRPVEKELTQQRVQQVFSALFDAYKALPSPQNLNTLRASLESLGVNLSGQERSPRQL